MDEQDVRMACLHAALKSVTEYEPSSSVLTRAEAYFAFVRGGAFLETATDSDEIPF